MQYNISDACRPLCSVQYEYWHSQILNVQSREQNMSTYLRDLQIILSPLCSTTVMCGLDATRSAVLYSSMMRDNTLQAPPNYHPGKSLRPSMPLCPSSLCFNRDCSLSISIPLPPRFTSQHILKTHHSGFTRPPHRLFHLAHLDPYVGQRYWTAHNRNLPESPDAFPAVLLQSVDWAWCVNLHDIPRFERINSPPRGCVRPPPRRFARSGNPSKRVNGVRAKRAFAFELGQDRPIHRTSRGSLEPVKCQAGSRREVAKVHPGGRGCGSGMSVRVGVGVLWTFLGVSVVMAGMTKPGGRVGEGAEGPSWQKMCRNRRERW